MYNMMSNCTSLDYVLILTISAGGEHACSASIPNPVHLIIIIMIGKVVFVTQLLRYSGRHRSHWLRNSRNNNMEAYGYSWEFHKNLRRCMKCIESAD